MLWTKNRPPREMTKGDFGVIVELLKGAYMGKIFYDTEGTQIKIYYQYLHVYDPYDVWQAVNKWISDNKLPPAISDLLELLDKVFTYEDWFKIYDEERKEREALKHED